MLVTDSVLLGDSYSLGIRVKGIPIDIDLADVTKSLGHRAAKRIQI